METGWVCACGRTNRAFSCPRCGRPKPADAASVPVTRSPGGMTRQVPRAWFEEPGPETPATVAESAATVPELARPVREEARTVPELQQPVRHEPPAAGASGEPSSREPSWMTATA